MSIVLLNLDGKLKTPWTAVTRPSFDDWCQRKPEGDRNVRFWRKADIPCVTYRVTYRMRIDEYSGAFVGEMTYPISWKTHGLTLARMHGNWPLPTRC
jgi:hypothetical protein